MPEAKAKSRQPIVEQPTSIGFASAMLSGLALVTVALMLVVLFGFLDALHYRSIADFFTPDPAAAGGTLALVGGAEGVTLSIVLLGVMFGIQTSSSRYSPRIIRIFTRNPLNALVLSFALASILYTFLVRSEVKVNYVPLASVAVAELLALVNFALLFPYVLYTFEVMRAETLVSGIRRRGRKELRAATRKRRVLQRRRALLTCMEQVTDIAFGSIQLGDMPVCQHSIEVLGDFLAREYLPVKKNMDPEWFKVGHAELPGASDQIVAEVNRAGTWFAYTIMSSFVDMVGLTPVHRKEAVYTIAVATRKVGLAAIEARVRDPQVSFRLAQLLVRNLLDLIPNARPIGLNGLFKGVAKLTCWSMASEEKDITHVLVEGIAAAPPDFVDAALSRMESMQSGLFWEVNERVISFDWVEQPLRDQIPRLRAALRRAKTGGNGAVIGALEDAPTIAQDLVQPEPSAAATPTPAPAPEPAC